MNWLADLLTNLASWIPRPVLLDPTEGGLRIGHRKRKVLQGGHRYWYVPLLQDIKTFPVVEQTADLPAQTLMTANKKPLVVSGILAYEVRDVETVMVRAHDVDDIVLDVGRAAVAEVVAGENLQCLLNSLRDGSLGHSLTLKTRARLRRYGIHVMRASLNEICPCSTVRVVGDAILPLPREESSSSE